MPILMKPVTFGCDNGFQEYYFDSESPDDNSKNRSGNIFCYLGRLTDEDKKSPECLKKCMSMKAGECWKV
ncbi:MAG: hypothetical protein U0354_12830 [Candidatus Sericytochromatia bacterium]